MAREQGPRRRDTVAPHHHGHPGLDPDQQRLVAHLARRAVRLHLDAALRRAAVTPTDHPGRYPRSRSQFASQITRGVLPLPPAVILPTMMTGTPTHTELSQPR